MDCIECTGVCESCEFAKYYPGDKNEGPFYTCDPIKIKDKRINMQTPHLNEVAYGE